MKNRNNIYFIYMYIFVGQLFFDRALWVIYLNEKGMSLGEIGIIEAILHLTIVLFEIPTGIIADLYGRKISILIGTILSIGYAGFMLISGNFAMFSLAFISMGLLVTFHSGAEQALAYESLKEQGREKEYTKVIGNMTAIALFSISLANLLGGWMAQFSWTFVYISMMIVHVIAVLPILLLKEPKKVESPTRTIQLSVREQWKNQISNSFEIWKQKRILHLPIIVFVTMGTVFVILSFYGQEYFLGMGFTTTQIGFIYTIEGLIGVGIAKLAHHLEKKLQFFKLITYGYGLFLCFILLFIVLNKWAVMMAFIFLAQIVTLVEPLFSNFVQNHISSQVRSTFFSMISWMSSFAIMLSFPVFGYLAEIVGFKWGFGCVLVVLLLLYSMILVNSKKQHQLEMTA
ncbi:MFS transporter [Bacillus timonensis]|nr:MFS transporter [Bacillus timonensis]